MTEKIETGSINIEKDFLKSIRKEFFDLYSEVQKKTSPMSPDIKKKVIDGILPLISACTEFGLSQETIDILKKMESKLKNNEEPEISEGDLKKTFDELEKKELNDQEKEKIKSANESFKKLKDELGKLKDELEKKKPASKKESWREKMGNKIGDEIDSLPGIGKFGLGAMIKDRFSDSAEDTSADKGSEEGGSSRWKRTLGIGATIGGFFARKNRDSVQERWGKTFPGSTKTDAEKTSEPTQPTSKLTSQPGGNNESSHNSSNESVEKLSDGDVRLSFITKAKELFGAKYQLGAQSDTKVDCSGMIIQTLRNMKYIPETYDNNAEGIYNTMVDPIDHKDLKPGDLLFWKLEDPATKGSNENIVNHVAIFEGRNADGKTMMVFDSAAGNIGKVSSRPQLLRDGKYDAYDKKRNNQIIAGRPKFFSHLAEGKKMDGSNLS